MVMRNLKVPTQKKFYLLRDAKREADWLNIPLGRVCDPLGSAIHRCYALIDHAKAHGRLRAFLQTFARSVWSEGVDAATDRGLARITEEAGLSWSTCQPLVNDRHWEPEVEQNRQTLNEAGHWGVPVLRYGDTAIWGQDRF